MYGFGFMHISGGSVRGFRRLWLGTFVVVYNTAVLAAFTFGGTVGVLGAEWVARRYW